MPDWSEPFHFPRLTDAEFRKARREYIAEHGYTITIPGLSDIIHIPVYDPMTLEEAKLWKEKRFDEIPPDRLRHLQKLKDKKKRQFLGMLGSPTPDVFRNAGSIMTAVDDAQDALNTIGMVGQIARAVGGKAVQKILTGPVGVIMTVADVLSLIQATSMKCQAPLLGKNASRSHAKGSPKKNKAGVKTASRLSRYVPDKADIIQALQTTDQVYGYGLCLGPLLGLAQDTIFGSILSIPGHPINVDLPVPDMEYWWLAAQKVAKSAWVLWAYPHATDYEQNMQSLAALQLSFQALTTANQRYNILDHIIDPFDLQIQAPVPTDVLTLEVIEEAGKRLEEVCGWPQTGTLWAPLQSVVDVSIKIATMNLENQLAANKHNFTGYASGMTTVDGAGYFLAALEGPDQVSEDITVDMKMALNMMHHSTCLDPAQGPEKFALFAEYMQRSEDLDQLPNMKEIREFCNGSAQISLLEY